ncbi:hypothetical protein N7520_006917 [Penicillium odoratum]|uniref:uncharacterized protein n=1 Tax=Penicillium odoratum TaxID=1167516 RepID=UPI002547CCA5|nr:uncharacterized protein N7520_006917 [Penicillium odoratum]KAJ5759761.1 hypothetical protein N7520_006917 [Penicillium odoratum]
MHLKLFTLFATLCTITTAVPFSHQEQTPTLTIIPKSASASHSQPSASASPTRIPVGAYQCPEKQYKACCMSLEEASKDIIVKPLSDLVPMFGGIQVSSKVSFQCNNMADDADPDTCSGHGYTPMCCSDQADKSSLNSCKSFASVKERYYQSFGYNVGEESQSDLVYDVMS